MYAEYETYLFAIGIMWWYHDLETLSALVALYEGNPPPIAGGLHLQRASNAELCHFQCY